MLTPATTRPEVPRWDSFAYVSFIVAVEVEYGIRFPIADVESFQTVGDIVTAIRHGSSRPRRCCSIRTSTSWSSCRSPCWSSSLLGRSSRSLALGWLILASVVFYAWWRPMNLAIIAPSIALNYALGRVLLGLAGDPARARRRTLLLVLGIVFNVCFLGYFKYANFAVTVVDDLSGQDFVFKQVILPLGISFITFQKIAFLIDVAGGRIKAFTLRDYLLFVMFFPQLIAGPIIHYGETIPQFERATCRFDRTLYAVGITLFCFGLFKKVVLADGMAAHVTPVFAYAASGAEATLLQSWLAAVGFTLQIYFDFSGYSDMACGAALFFGVRLPINFNSPLKATSIVDFWLRWHITLTRFLTAYVYNPMALTLTRARAARRLPMLRARDTPPARLPARARLPDDHHHGALRHLARGGLHLHPLGPAARALPRGQPPLAPVRAAAGADGRRRGAGAGGAARGLRADLPRGRRRHGAVPRPRPRLGRQPPRRHGRPARARDAGGALRRRGHAPARRQRARCTPSPAPSAILLALLAIALLLPNSVQILAAYEPVLYTPKRAAEMPGVLRPVLPRVMGRPLRLAPDPRPGWCSSPPSARCR